MKKIILLSFLFLLASCSEKIYLYNAEISSNDVNGTNKFGPKSSSKHSKLIKDPVIVPKYWSNLGTLVSKDDPKNDNPFLNYIYLKGNYGAIDSLYINFLQQLVIPNTSIIDGVSSEKYLSFVNSFNNMRDYKSQKEYLFFDENRIIRAYMEGQIYIISENNITQAHKLEKIVKGKIESNIEMALEQYNSTIKAEIKAELMDMVNKSVNIKGNYVEITLNPTFRSMIENLLLHYKHDPPLDFKNPFTVNFYKYYLQDKNYFSDGCGILNFTINYNTTQISKADIAAVIDAQSSLTEAQKKDISANVYASFSVDKNFTGSSESSKSYLVKYQYNTNAELNRPTGNPMVYSVETTEVK